MEKEPHVFEEDDEAFLRSLNALLEEPEPQETQAPQDAPMPKKPQVGKKRMPPKTGGFWKKLGIGTAIAAAVALDKIHALGAKAAVSVKPNTPASAVLPFLDKVDMILVMTVEPGFGGQSFLENQMEKLAALGALCAERNPECLLEVDGGVNAQTGALCRQSGANVLVAGSAFFKAKDKAAFVKEIEAAV